MVAGASFAGAAGWIAGQSLAISAAAAATVAVALLVRRLARRSVPGASCRVPTAADAGCGCK
ncbi:hypothetical protein HK414_08170 [Ramlibacter terrae]|uniref:MFS transporter n=1 Tax=Ramlibacter terrae TaxID=2732511 RepID=A0ABX6P3L8_9BURK|nr:hypothetical protein HK414_08170 [Ramlibacter terrae]